MSTAHGQTPTVEEVLKMMSEGTIDEKTMITHKYPMAEIKETKYLHQQT